MTKKNLMKLKYALRFLPDKVYIQLYYFYNFRKLCNFNNPITYNEKIQWLKLHDHNPLYTSLVDKYEVKKYVEDKIGKEYIIPTLAVYDNAEQIDIQALPNQFVLKCTHDSEGLAICKDKSTFDLQKAKEKLNAAFNRNYYYIGREWPYKNVQRRIIAEKYMEDTSVGELRDYKFLCFNGSPEIMFIATNRFGDEVHFDYYDMNFNHLDVVQSYSNSKDVLARPVNFNKMIEFAKILSRPFKHVRVDFYEVEGRLYFGELTFYHFSGFSPFKPEKWDYKLGKFLEL